MLKKLFSSREINEQRFKDVLGNTNKYIDFPQLSFLNSNFIYPKIGNSYKVQFRIKPTNKIIGYILYWLINKFTRRSLVISEYFDEIEETKENK